MSPGCVYDALPIGLFRMVDQGKLDEKVLAYATGNPHFRGAQEYTEIQSHVLQEIEYFFSVYKFLEGKESSVLGWSSATEAKKTINSAHSAFMNIQNTEAARKVELSSHR